MYTCFLTHCFFFLQARVLQCPTLGVKRAGGKGTDKKHFNKYVSFAGAIKALELLYGAFAPWFTPMISASVNVLTSVEWFPPCSFTQ